MKKRYHITPSRQIKECTAKDDASCPLSNSKSGYIHPHFDSEKEAEEYKNNMSNEVGPMFHFSDEKSEDDIRNELDDIIIDIDKKIRFSFDEIKSNAADIEFEIDAIMEDIKTKIQDLNEAYKKLEDLDSKF